MDVHSGYRARDTCDRTEPDTAAPVTSTRRGKRSFDVAFLMLPDDRTRRRSPPPPPPTEEQHIDVGTEEPPLPSRSAFTRVSPPSPTDSYSPPPYSPPPPTLRYPSPPYPFLLGARVPPSPAAALLGSLLPPTLAAFSLPAQNVCAKCSVSFRMTSDLVYHMRTQHKPGGGPAGSAGGERRRADKLRCPVCRESFRERHHLTRHMTAHQDKDGDAP